MENLSRSISRSLSRSVSSSLNVNKFWRRRSYDGRFDGRRSVRTAQLGESRSMFWKIKNLFTLARSQQHGFGSKTTSKPRPVSDSKDDFQNRMLFEIYKNM
ncbi:hypothetical protein L6452_40974 [Arctium lappa]|uniref:Uncharacterized protein n=1 Tax=Arctium lappa TaxID=4217 RepID=A0ACB8XNR2_ARCLA|nr:hypothetical protein L6452_40974 [Arctium lappa]